ncbi:hypothetical protein VCRA2117O328_350004 [Vibrio crassostreae]|nr:hypothetical protein VCRA2117O328_350004 [Vibrio crassostreae]
MSNATTEPDHTTLNTKPNDEMKNAMRWESALNACYIFFDTDSIFAMALS